MFAIVMSAGVLIAGLWLTASQNDSVMGMWGAMLLILGATFLAFNLYARSKGFTMRRRR